MSSWTEPMGLVLVGAMSGCSVSCLGYALLACEREVEPRILWGLMLATFLSLCVFVAVMLRELL